jgi:acid phosphatase (class A)
MSWIAQKKKKQNPTPKSPWVFHLLRLIIVPPALIAGRISNTFPLPFWDVKEFRPRDLDDDLRSDQPPDSSSPPTTTSAERSAAVKADLQSVRTRPAQVNTLRRHQPAMDARTTPDKRGVFSRVLDIRIPPKAPPICMPPRTQTDAIPLRLGTGKKYHHVRPLTLFCPKTPLRDWERRRTPDISYPSGHAVVGWTWALIFVEIALEDTDAFSVRAVTFGQSAVIGDAHRPSDVNAGFMVISNHVARPHRDYIFPARLDASTTEWTGVRATGIKPKVDRKSEVKASAFQL